MEPSVIAPSPSSDQIRTDAPPSLNSTPSPIPSPPLSPSPSPPASPSPSSPLPTPTPTPTPTPATSTPSPAPRPYQGPPDWPGPPSWNPGLSEKEERQLAHILGHMHELSRPTGFAPTREDFRREAGISHKAYLKYFSNYSEMVSRCGYKTYADKKRVAKVELRKAMNLSPEPVFVPIKDDVAYGDRIEGYDLLHAPINEQGVVMLFGMMAKKLGFLIEVVRGGYPDCEAKRKCADGMWRRVRIEFEFETSRFDHDPIGCDLIVCWRDDAKGLGIEVLELKQILEIEAQAKATGATHAAAN